MNHSSEVSKGIAFHLMAVFSLTSSILKCSSFEGTFYFREKKVGCYKVRRIKWVANLLQTMVDQ